MVMGGYEYEEEQRGSGNGSGKFSLYPLGTRYTMGCYTGLGTYTLRTFFDAIYQAGIQCFVDLSNAVKV